jgi:uncharacterized GH25 family protein
MAGRYQGYHRFTDKTGDFEIFWRADGWWWWRRTAGRAPESKAIGPFLTSTEAYQNAVAAAASQGVS